MRPPFPFGLTSELKTHVPYEELVNSFRVRATTGKRFKVGKITSQRAVFYYGNVGSTKESQGYRTSFVNEVLILNGTTQTTPVVIKFRTPNSHRVGWLVITFFILFFSRTILKMSLSL